MTNLRFLGSRDEIGNIRTFVFEKPEEAWVPGQYQVYVLKDVKGDDDAKTRYFTIASAPSENVVHISTRVSGSDFKQALNGLKVGDEIETKELGGDFTWDDDAPVVLVAAGIGVTPYRSFLVERAATSRAIPAHLLYFGRDENFAFKAEFDKIAATHPELRIDYIVGEQISADNIIERAPESKDQVVYLSGPEPMVDAVGDDLTKHGVKVKQDWFPGYTEQNY